MSRDLDGSGDHSVERALYAGDNSKIFNVVAKNEADRISTYLRSVQGIVDEIVVVDSGSTDETVKISASFGAITYFRPWEGFGQQKRYAEDKATDDWILNLDADEWLTEELRAEIKILT